MNRRAIALFAALVVVLPATTGVGFALATQPLAEDEPSDLGVAYSTDYMSIGDGGWFSVTVTDMGDAELVRVAIAPAFENHQAPQWLITNSTRMDGLPSENIIGMVNTGQYTLANDTSEIRDGDTVVVTALGDGREVVLETHTFEKAREEQS